MICGAALNGTLLCLVCCIPCGQTTSVMSLCHAVLRGLGGKCISVSLYRWWKARWCKCGDAGRNPHFYCEIARRPV